MRTTEMTRGTPPDNSTGPASVRTAPRRRNWALTIVVPLAVLALGVGVLWMGRWWFDRRVSPAALGQSP